MSGVRVRPNAGGVDEADHTTGRSTEAGKDVDLFTGSIAVEGVEVAEHLQAGLGGVDKAGADAIEVDLDVAKATLTRIGNDLMQVNLGGRVIRVDPVRSCRVERVGIHERGNALSVFLNGIGMLCAERMLRD